MWHMQDSPLQIKLIESCWYWYFGFQLIPHLRLLVHLRYANDEWFEALQCILNWNLMMANYLQMSQAWKLKFLSQTWQIVNILLMTHTIPLKAVSVHQCKQKIVTSALAHWTNVPVILQNRYLSIDFISYLPLIIFKNGKEITLSLILIKIQ